jgi:hypothetical protein
MLMIQPECVCIYCAQNILASSSPTRINLVLEPKPVHNVKLKDKTRLTGEQTVVFSKSRCGVGAQNPNGSKSQTDHGTTASHRTVNGAEQQTNDRS